jgi:hypothetical protein
MKARWIGENVVDGFETFVVPGDVGTGAENWHYNVLVCCPVCHELHVVETHEPKRWEWNRTALTITPSYMTRGGGREGVCHWNLTNGEFIIHGDSTATPIRRTE